MGSEPQDARRYDFQLLDSVRQMRPLALRSILLFGSGVAQFDLQPASFFVQNSTVSGCTTSKFDMGS